MHGYALQYKLTPRMWRIITESSCCPTLYRRSRSRCRMPRPRFAKSSRNRKSTNCSPRGSRRCARKRKSMSWFPSFRSRRQCNHEAPRNPMAQDCQVLCFRHPAVAASSRRGALVRDYRLFPKDGPSPPDRGNRTRHRRTG